MEELLYTKIKILIFTLLSLWVVPVIASHCLYSEKLNHVSCKNKSIRNESIGDIEPTFIAYRLAVKGSSERKCRLEPTCSKFLIHAIKHHGLSKGILFGFARAQIKHDDGFGLLPISISSDDFLIVLDPVNNWKFLK